MSLGRMAVGKYFASKTFKRTDPSPSHILICLSDVSEARVNRRMRMEA